MDYIVGRLYLIRNVATGEGTYCEPHEILDYKGRRILYGEVRSHRVSVQGAIRDRPGRPVAFPLVDPRGKVEAAALAMCIAETGGDDGTGRPFGQLRISPLPDGMDARTHQVKLLTPGYTEEEPVYATSKQLANAWRGTPFKEADCSVCAGWGGPTCQGHAVNRDGLVAYCGRLIDLYNDVVRLERLPVWFLWQRRLITNAGGRKLVVPETRRQLW